MSQRGPANKFGYRAVAGGIPTNSVMRDFGKSTIRFDPRSTAQAHETRSEVNGIIQGREHRKAVWEQRQRDKRAQSIRDQRKSV